MFTIYVISLLKCNECIYLIENKNEEAGKMPEQHTKEDTSTIVLEKKRSF